MPARAARCQRRTSIAAGGLLVCWAAVASADPAGDRAAQETLHFHPLPTSPAFTFLGISPEIVSRPSTPRDLAVTILSAIDSLGRVQQGFALEVTPWYLVPGFDIPLAEYRSSWWKFLAANAQASLGSVRVASDSGSTDVALGLRLTLRDDGDPMRSRAFAARLGEALLECAPDEPGAEISDACLEEKSRALRQAWLADHWNARVVALAAASGLRFVGSDISDSRGLGWSTWLVASNPVGRWGQIVVHLQYTQRRRIDELPEFSSMTYAARFAGGSSRFDTFLELASVAPIDAEGADAHGAWSGGVEFRVAEDLWLSTGFGSTFATEQRADRILLIANLRWGVSSGARLGRAQR